MKSLLYLPIQSKKYLKKLSKKLFNFICIHVTSIKYYQHKQDKLVKYKVEKQLK